MNYTEGPTTTLTCEDCGAAHQELDSLLAWAAARPTNYPAQMRRLYCEPCRRERIVAAITGPAMQQALQALREHS